MKKRISAGIFPIICTFIIFLTSCGNYAEKPNAVNHNSRNEEIGTSESASESIITKDAKTSEGIAENPTTETAISENVTFGSYPQQNDNAEPIEWIVLNDDNESIMLLSKYCLASLPWHNKYEAVTWDKSDIRKWLNGDFPETAFSKTEQDAIVPTVPDNEDDLKYGTHVGENTTDSVFLLSTGEAMTFLDTDERTAAPTAYALKQGAYTNGSGNCAWWLRSPGMTDTSPAYFASSGEIGTRAHEVNEQIIGVRPVIRVKKEFFSNTETVSNSMQKDAAALYDRFKIDQMRIFCKPTYMRKILT